MVPAPRFITWMPLPALWVVSISQASQLPFLSNEKSATLPKLRALSSLGSLEEARSTSSMSAPVGRSSGGVAPGVAAGAGVAGGGVAPPAGAPDGPAGVGA